jgi:crotonobetainyl-CoA:carnitine CoA-transferase CaiB-like acyl-CoA transferase
MQGPLAGIRVVDLTAMVLGPVATQILGDMGADVVKVEPPDGDPMRQVGPARSAGMSAFFINMNRNKRSVVLDLKDPAGRENFLRLVRKSDVVVHNMRPAAAQRLGIAYADLVTCNARIICALAPGFRAAGPYAARPAYDDIIQGASGLVAMNIRSTGEARYMPTALADKLVGHVLASAIGMALFHRERTGQGQEVIVPMFETMVAFNMLDHLYGGTFSQTAEAVGYPRLLSPHRRPYPTSDGHICVMAHTDEQWRRMFQVIGRPEFAQDPRYARLAQRTENLQDLLLIVAEQMVTRTTAAWQSALDAADIPNGSVNKLEDLFDDPQLRATGFFRHLEHPTEGSLLTPDIAVEFSATPGALRHAAPCLGENNADIAREFGFTTAEPVAASHR